MEKTALGERPVQQTHVVTEIEAMEEEMFLGLRKSNGVSFLYSKRSSENRLKMFTGKHCNRLLKKDLSNDWMMRLKLTHRGVYQRKRSVSAIS